MWTRDFVQSLNYDAVPRTTVPIEQFNRVVAVTFDTVHATKSQYANCAECVVMAKGGLQLAMRRLCQVKADD